MLIAGKDSPRVEWDDVFFNTVAVNSMVRFSPVAVHARGMRRRNEGADSSERRARWKEDATGRLG